MNPDQPSREQIESRITALLLGELPADEAALLRYTMAQDPALQQLHDELQSTLVLVREAAKHPADAPVEKNAPLRLSVERRQKLLAHFKTQRPKTTAKQEPLFWLKPIKMPPLTTLVISAFVVLFVIGIAALSIPHFVKARSTSQSSTVINNLRQMDAAKAEWALVNKKSGNDVPTPNDLTPYQKEIKSVVGETYVLGKVSEPVAANLDASLVKDQLPRLAAKLPRGGGKDQQVRLSSDGELSFANNSAANAIVTARSIEPALAPPPAPIVASPTPNTPIVLPQSETTPEVAAVTGASTEFGKAGVESQNVVGYANVPLAAGETLTMAPPPVPASAAPAPAETPSAQMALNHDNGQQTAAKQASAEPVENQWKVPSQDTDSSVSFSSVAGGTGGGGAGFAFGGGGFGNRNGATPQSAADASPPLPIGGGFGVEATPPPAAPPQVVSAPMAANAAPENPPYDRSLIEAQREGEQKEFKHSGHYEGFFAPTQPNSESLARNDAGVDRSIGGYPPYKGGHGFALGGPIGHGNEEAPLVAAPPPASAAMPLGQFPAITPNGISDVYANEQKLFTVQTPNEIKRLKAEPTKKSQPEFIGSLQSGAIPSGRAGGIAGNRFYRNQVQESDDKKVPVLGDVPVTGNLFQNSAKAEVRIPAPTAAPAAPATAAFKFDTDDGRFQGAEDLIGANQTFNSTLKSAGENAFVAGASASGGTLASGTSDRDQSAQVIEINNGNPEPAAQELRKIFPSSAGLTPQGVLLAQNGNSSLQTTRAQNNGTTVTYGTAPVVDASVINNAGEINLGAASDSFSLGLDKGTQPLSGVPTAGFGNSDKEHTLKDAVRKRELQQNKASDNAESVYLPRSSDGDTSPEWAGVLDKPVPHSPNNHFTSRYAYIAPNSAGVDQFQSTNAVVLNGGTLNFFGLDQPPIGYHQGSTDQDYKATKEQLDQMRRLHELLNSKLEAEKLDLNLPEKSLVQVTDPAQPGRSQNTWQRLTGQVESKARIKIENDAADIQGLNGNPQVASYDPYFIQTTFEIMQSELVLGKVVDALNLQSAWAQKNGGEKLTKKEAISLLQHRLDLHPVPNTKLIEIGVTSNDPKESADIANAVAKAYADYRAESRRALTTNGLAVLEDQFAQQQKEIQLAQAKVERLGKELTPKQSTPELAPGSYVTQVVQLKYVKPTEMVPVIQPFARLTNSILPNDNNGTLVLSDNAENVKRMLEMIAQVDVSVPAEYISEAIPIRYAKVDDIASALNELSGKEMQLVGQTKIIANESSSSLLIYATRTDMEVLKRAIAKLDTKTQAAEQTDLPLRKPAPNAPVPQPEILTSSNAFSTFSLNVSDVSFKFAEASLQNGKLPDTASIRSEEFINAFDYRDPEAAEGQPMAFTSERARYPFAHNRELLRFAIKTAAAGRQAGRALNLVLLLDNSGSMERADRVAIIHEALRVLATQLQPQDTVSVVTFARTARLWADGVGGDKAGETLDQVGGITPEGGTNLEEAMRLAYETARRHYLAGGMNRVVLLTDGAANLGNVDPDALKRTVEAQRKQGIALDCFGIGWEDYNDDLLEQLSSNGDGRYAFLNSPEDASKDFAAKLAGALQIAAADVKVQVEFNPARVISYRQIGYATHQLTKEQFRDNTVAAGQIAAQEAGNALYTIETNPDGDGPVATVHVRYKIPGTEDYREHSWDVAYTGGAPALEQSSPAMRLAATASAFSEWLAASPYAQEVTLDELLKDLSGVPEIYGADDRPKQLETMIREAKSLEGK